ncbi:hypothetical protein K0M31_016689, partial [Melipona bicolor]
KLRYKRPIWRPAATCKKNHFGARHSATLGGRHRPVFFLFSSGSPSNRSPGLELAPGIAFLTTERQKLPFQGRSFGTEWWTTDVDIGKKKTRAAASCRF